MRQKNDRKEAMDVRGKEAGVSRSRGTMLVSTAVILCVICFAAGFMGGTLVAEYRSLKAEPAAEHVHQHEAPAGETAEQALSSEIQKLRDATKAEPSRADLWTRLGNACYDAGIYDEAIHAYEHSLKLAPGNADVITDMGSMYRMKGMAQKAVECYEEAQRLQPGHRNAIFNKGVTLMLDMEQPEKAMHFWRGILASSPDFRLGNGVPLRQALLEVAVDAGLKLEQHGRTETALRAYAEALKEDAGHVPALIHRAWLLKKLGRNEEALPLWQKVLQLRPDATDPQGDPIRLHVQP